MSWKRTFIFAFFAQFLGIVGISFATPFLPFFVGELGVSEGGAQAFWAGIVLASGAVAYAVFAPVWGIVADRIGRKAMVCRAMFGAAAAVLLMSFATTVPQMILFRVIQGIFSGTLAASIALVASVTPLNLIRIRHLQSTCPFGSLRQPGPPGFSARGETVCAMRRSGASAEES